MNCCDAQARKNRGVTCACRRSCYNAAVPETIHAWRYRMKARAPLNRKSPALQVEGMLLRIDGGYACVQPWSVFGHPTLEEHEQALREKRSLPLLDQAFSCAEADAEARRKGVSWWTGLSVPRSHATITDLTEDHPESALAPFSHAKIKARVEDTQQLHEWSQRHPHLSLRLDFNEVPNEKAFVDWWEKLSDELRRRIDWVEDPFPFDSEAWQRVQSQTGCAFACDRAVDLLRSDHAFVAVWKPAWQPLPCSVLQQNVVVTSAMDHPVGQAWAAYSAGLAGVTSLCGLRTDPLFEKNAFSERMGSWGPDWPRIDGMGMGFDDLLENLPWVRMM
ncbi:MAG: hypothetical protein RLZZ224_2127 [Verrucomicrobiota bacterium]